jgi:hypothetical protein
MMRALSLDGVRPEANAAPGCTQTSPHYMGRYAAPTPAPQLTEKEKNGDSYA